MPRFDTIVLWVLFVTIFLSGIARAHEPSFRLGTPLTSHMVLQRDVPVPIWGTDVPGTIVEVTTHGETRTATAGPEGRWRVDIGPFSIGDPISIRVSGTETVELEDVLIGEVWFASGQSNMAFQLHQMTGGDEEIASATNTSIRLFSVPTNGALEPLDFIDGGKWDVCTPELASRFSAIAYLFGKELHEQLEVPVGVIFSSWGGASMEAWTPLRAMASDPVLSWTVGEQREYASKVGEYERDLAVALEQQAAFRAVHRETEVLADPGDGDVPGEWWKPEFDDSSWETMEVPRATQSTLGSLDGLFLHRRTVSIPQEWVGKRLTVSLGSIVNSDVTWFDGHEIGRTHVPTGASRFRAYEVPGELATGGESVIAVRVFDSDYLGGIFGPEGEMKIAPSDGSGTPIMLSGEWTYKVAWSVLGQPSIPDNPARGVPSMLYNGMVAPIVPFRFRGVIWYQGEGNTSRANQYRHLSQVMIESWRNQFGHEFPFLYVQLAGYDTNEAGWLEVMEAQLQTLEVANTAMASAADLGDPDDIHPRDKKPVAYRLALAALGKVYGKEVTYTNPTPLSVRRIDSGALVDFGEVSGGLEMRQAANESSFELADSDGVFHPASAELDGTQVTVKSPAVSTPRLIRYAWRRNPNCILYSGNGLPVPPFRTVIGE